MALPFAFPFPQHGINNNDNGINDNENVVHGYEAGQFQAAMNAAALTAAQNPFAMGAGQQQVASAVLPPPMPAQRNMPPAGGFGQKAPKTWTRPVNCLQTRSATLS